MLDLFTLVSPYQMQTGSSKSSGTVPTEIESCSGSKHVVRAPKFLSRVSKDIPSIQQSATDGSSDHTKWSASSGSSTFVLTHFLTEM